MSGPMIPGAREPGSLTTFGVPAAILRITPVAATSMDSATTAARQREGGGSPDQRRPNGPAARKNVFGTAFAWLLNE